MYTVPGGEPSSSLPPATPVVDTVTSASSNTATPAARHRAALCVHDLLADHPFELTTDWTYDVYAYFNNDICGHAVQDALHLRHALTAEE
jgi:uncharacterized protein YecE (DUF72 family)